MRVKTITLIVFISAIVLLMTTSCSRHTVYHEPTVINTGGPPAHAPAHGYRRKHMHGRELVFDASLGLYVVVGLSDHYYHDGYFYRLNGGTWQMSVKPEGSWKVVATSSLPVGLQAKAISSKGNGRGKDNGNGKGKSNGRGKGKGKHNKDVVSMGKRF